MASAQDDTASADNPNSQDLPEGDQQGSIKGLGFRVSEN